MSDEIKKISIKAILEDLYNGLTRFPEGDDYVDAVGSIQAKYLLDKYQVIEIFRHPKLKGKKTRKNKEPDFILVDDTEESVVEHPVTSEEGKIIPLAYGARPAGRQPVKMSSPPAVQAVEVTQESTPEIVIETIEF